MAGQWDDWLAVLRAAGKGPVTLYAPRHTDFAATVTINDDLTGATMRGEVRASPDAGAALATFTVSAASVVSGVTTFGVSLAQALVEPLPPDSATEGSVALVYDLLVTPLGGDEELLFGGQFVVIGGATQ